MKPITMWELKTKIVTKLENGEEDIKYIWLHNHIEDGHCESNTPTVKFDTQKGWKNGVWQKEFAYLMDNKIVRRA